MFGYGNHRSHSPPQPPPSSNSSFLNTSTKKKGATYSSIEGQLRKAKRIAATLSDDRKKSEEIALTEDGTKSKETHSGAHFTPALVKRSAQLPSWGFSAEVLVKEEKKGMVGTKVLGGRVVKGSAASAARGSGRKKEGIKVEDEVEVLEVFHLDDG